jgi:transposase
LSPLAARSSARAFPRAHRADPPQGALGARPHAAGTISPRGRAIARGHLFNQVLDALEDVGTIPDVQRFARHLTTELPALFSFLVDPTLDATNWRAEQALRPAVITRKVCGGGNRSQHGAETQQVLASIIRTAQQRHLDADVIITTWLYAHTPIVSPTVLSSEHFSQLTR